MEVIITIRIIAATDDHDQVSAVTPAKHSSDEQPRLGRIKSIGVNLIRSAPSLTQIEDHANTVGKLYCLTHFILSGNQKLYSSCC